MKIYEQSSSGLRELKTQDVEAICDCCKHHDQHRIEIIRCPGCHKPCTCVCHEES